ncbi:MAG: hypothetical protein HY705_03185, partial [Gemmatimonadetes bacterium]|nr:hypothetical protein [Gemmatimonadota bacterium]
MSGVLRDLAAVRRTLGLRGALALVLGAAAAFALVAAGAALAARLGLFRWMAWGPLALWVAAGLAGALVARSLRRIGAGARGGLRETAALVERELALRRGAFVGLVDVGQGPPAGTSAGLAGSAARRMEARLPPGGGLGWVPRSAGVLARRLRARGALLAAALLAAAISFRVAGDAAASLVSPLRAWRAAAAARVQIAVSARMVSPGGDVVVTVSAGAARRPTLHVRAMGEPWRSIPLDADEGGRAAHRLRDIRAPLFVYASAGDVVSDTLRVGVATPAFLTAFAVTARYPVYLERPDEAFPVDAEPVGVPVGTVLAVSGAASAPLAGATLAAQAGEVPLEVSGSSFAGELVVRGSARWHLALAARQGGALAEPLPTLDVRAVPDSAPVVGVPVPGADTTAPLDLKPAVVVDARDDHG